MVTRKLIGTYALLVGLPVLILLGVLEAGRELKAAASISGVWRVDSGFETGVDHACFSNATANQPSTLAIEQSGRFISVSIAPSRLPAASGTIQGNDLRVNAAGGGREGISDLCNDQTPYRLSATLERNSGQSMLKGLVAVDGCATCQPVAFTAVKAAAEGR